MDGKRALEPQGETRGTRTRSRKREQGTFGAACRPDDCACNDAVTTSTTPTKALAPGVARFAPP
jgi:hypothetical protein